MTNNDFYWYWFTNIAGIGVKTQKKLLEHFGHPSTIYNAPESEIKGILTTGQCKEVIASKNQKKIEASIRKLEKREIYFFHRESQEYPERLAQLYEPPNLLYYIGRLPNFSKPILAIVGARRATIYGRKMAREFAKRLAECGIQIVSGMAAGVDAAGHKGALDANGYTLGVLGGGIDTIYPVENFNLYQQVYQMGGVLSEYNMGISPQKGLFPMRNRIISGLSDGIFVTEAGARSGSLITADQGLEQGKDIFALPGRITDCMSRGCNDLISQGAVLVRSPEDIMDIIIKEGKTGNKKKNMDVNREKFFKEQKFFCENKKELNSYRSVYRKEFSSFFSQEIASCERKSLRRGAHCPVDNGFAPTETECRLRSSQRGNCICSLLARGTKVVRSTLLFNHHSSHSAEEEWMFLTVRST